MNNFFVNIGVVATALNNRFELRKTGTLGDPDFTRKRYCQLQNNYFIFIYDK